MSMPSITTVGIGSNTLRLATSELSVYIQCASAWRLCHRTCLNQVEASSVGMPSTGTEGVGSKSLSLTITV